MSVLTRIIDMHRSVRDHTVGLYQEWIGVRTKLAAVFGVKPGNVVGKVVGINNFIWVAGLAVAGWDVWNQLPAIMERVLSGEIDSDPGDASPFVDKARVKARVFQLYGALPVAGDRHISDFLPSIICPETNWGAGFGFKLTTTDDRQGIMMFERARIESFLAGATPILTALVTGGRYEGIMNLPNAGQIDDLPANVIVQTYGTIAAGGAHTSPSDSLPPAVHALVERQVRNQELTIQAALGGDRCLELQAVLNDPFTGRLPVNEIEKRLDELLEANCAYLPLFFEKRWGWELSS